MTRKRFVKLNMGCRISRNTANKIADIAMENGVPYAVAFADEVEIAVKIALRAIEERIWSVRDVKQAILAGTYET